MSPLDIIELPGHPGMYARRVLVEAWIAAGSPPPTSAGRLYAKQKYYWDGWIARLPGFNPADNPDDETQRLAHVRFVAVDIDPTPERIRRLEEAGLIRPYKYEPWHWEVPDVRSYAIVRSIPAPAATGASTSREQDELTMTSPIWNVVGKIGDARSSGTLYYGTESGKVEKLTGYSRELVSIAFFGAQAATEGGPIPDLIPTVADRGGDWARVQALYKAIKSRP